MTLSIVRKPWSMAELAAGYGEQQVLEIILGLSQK
jgi:hypothetical protein